ncbi:MAG: hypothetical protein IKP88_17610 [Lachnospiraceae bacterium]|nr:hypothetical protein [Lachnospiraceae bacterium]
MNSIMVVLKCITNLHVGNGDVNYNIIDSEVEKDPVTGYPMINSSGVKGALRAYFKSMNDPNVITWFGQEHNNAQNIQEGMLKIDDARMMAIPMRASKGDRAYRLVSTNDAIDKYNDIAAIFGLGTRIRDTKKPVSGIELEGYIAPMKLYDRDIYIISAADMSEYSLPVNARNCLDNGVSVNLWYEEYVPHESMFYFPVIADDPQVLNAFKGAIDNKVIQFGGHASIGYGFCKIKVEA